MRFAAHPCLRCELPNSNKRRGRQPVSATRFGLPCLCCGRRPRMGNRAIAQLLRSHKGCGYQRLPPGLGASQFEQTPGPPTYLRDTVWAALPVPRSPAANGEPCVGRQYKRSRKGCGYQWGFIRCSTCILACESHANSVILLPSIHPARGMNRSLEGTPDATILPKSPASFPA